MKTINCFDEMFLQKCWSIRNQFSDEIAQPSMRTQFFFLNISRKLVSLCCVYDYHSNRPSFIHSSQWNKEALAYLNALVLCVDSIWNVKQRRKWREKIRLPKGKWWHTNLHGKFFRKLIHSSHTIVVIKAKRDLKKIIDETNSGLHKAGKINWLNHRMK